MMKFMILFLLVGASAFANSMVTMTGTLTSITDKNVVVQRQKTSYFIKKSAVSPDEMATLPKTGKTVTLHVPLEAIEATKRER